MFLWIAAFVKKVTSSFITPMNRNDKKKEERRQWKGIDS